MGKLFGHFFFWFNSWFSVCALLLVTELCHGIVELVILTSICFPLVEWKMEFF
jgi:hypothetical protein